MPKTLRRKYQEEMWKDNLVSNSSKSNLFGVTNLFKKDDLQHKCFLENFVLLIMENHLHLQFVKSAWLKSLVMHLCLQMVFSSRNVFFTKNVFFTWWKKPNKSMYLATILDLRMSMGTHNVFSFIISFLKVDWEPKHIIINGLVEAIKTIDQVLATISN